VPVDVDALDLLRGGELIVLGPLPRASNATFLAKVRDGSREVLAVYKPRAGETPLWDFPDGTLYRREVAAFEVAEALGWPSVPPTVIRDGPGGIGSVQLFVRADPREHYFTLAESRADDFRRVALFDLVVNNADRKSGHCLLGDDGTIWMVDHGVCFAAEPKLRTVIWEFAGEPVMAPMRADFERLATAFREGPLRERLYELLSPNEVAVTASRADRVSRLQRFPHPGPGRAWPWPPV
jgi:hypothetical protein